MKYLAFKLGVVVILGLFADSKARELPTEIVWKSVDNMGGNIQAIIPARKGEGVPSMFTIYLSQLAPKDFGFGVAFFYSHPNRGASCEEAYKPIDLWLGEEEVGGLISCSISPETGAVTKIVYPASVGSVAQAVDLLSQAKKSLALAFDDLSIELPVEMLMGMWRSKYDYNKNQAIANLGWSLEGDGIMWDSLVVDEDLVGRRVRVKYFFGDESSNVALAVGRNKGDRCLKKTQLVIAEIDGTPVRMERYCDNSKDMALYQFDTMEGEQYFLDLLIDKKEPVEFLMGFRFSIQTRDFGELYSRYKNAL